MAKANGINKKLLAKKDMNFFAEFTANAAKQARLLGYGIVVGVLVVVVVLAFIIAFVIRNSIKKTEINELKALLDSPDYASLEADAEQLTAQLNEMENNYYALTQMRRDVDLIDPAPTDLPDIMGKCIPNDSFLSSYSVTSAELKITGHTFTYYSPVDMVNMLNDSDVFTARPIITIQREDPDDEEEITVEELIAGQATINAINNYYLFTVEGTLVSNVHISVTRLAEGEDVITLGGINTIDVRAGNTYSIENVDKYKYAGTNYELSRIFVNGTEVDAASLAKVIETGTYTDVGRGNYDIRFYYTVAAAADEPAEG